MTDTHTNISFNTLQLELSPGNSVPDEVQLIPYGRFRGRDGRRFQMLDVDAVIANTLKWYNPDSNSDKLDLVIDYEHQTRLSDKNGQPAPAAAWIKQLINKGKGGLWGKVEWTGKAHNQVKNREYRYLSPVFSIDKQGNVIALKCAGLTNYPNLEIQAFNKSNFNEEDKQVDLFAQLILLLGLADNASEKDVIEAVTQLKNAGNAESLNKIAAVLGETKADEKSIITAINKQLATSVDAAKYAALDAEVTALKEAMAVNKAEIAVNKAIADGQLVPALKENALTIHKSLGEQVFNDFIAKMPKLNLNNSETPAAGTTPAGSSNLSAEEVAVCKALGVSAEDYKKTVEQEKANATV